ncbi:ribose 5-phosphate isomerase B [Psychroflexus gondwanensis]|jgi:ribose 5-phosphate isomerase B|uniref:Ribose 5-phosphate isomerase B RpiB n=1 Tax=Psychroflexus gondwanensis ACAM 44 TaxID=1189619 RepID=N1WZS9_9FLAO|nr:ribose 5-phosphate isomerase B [Psychroflexus gondwanensis]EMY82687.1 ribose 5-phosphate isomerase B RpiB [Psychroflexus gondwanensis ACAM 44]TXE17028.1 ribose 5-phosphate isomerase B [Psychroflexus gondwanensis]
MTISIGNDHAGTSYKNKIVSYLKSQNIEVHNHGTNTEVSVDYPDFVHPVATDVEDGVSNLGIIICGSGNGANMTANKHQGIRSALCWTSELVALAKQHNNANVLSIPSRFVSEEEALDFVKVFLKTPFEGGRHQLRVNKIACH